MPTEQELLRTIHDKEGEGQADVTDATLATSPAAKTRDYESAGDAYDAAATARGQLGDRKAGDADNLKTDAERKDRDVENKKAASDALPPGPARTDTQAALERAEAAAESAQEKAA